MIFNFIKRSKNLTDLIPKDSVDIHNHILPGIDDGAKDVNESLELINGMKNLGYKKIIATPHIYNKLYENNRESITNSYNLIKNKLPKDIEFEFSAEYMLDNIFINKIDDEKLLTINKKYILVETGFISKPIFFDEATLKLSSNGYKIILAHPERYPYAQDIKTIKSFRNKGIFIQMNLLSICGYYGNKIKKISNEFINNKLVDFIGTDIHNYNQLNYIKNAKINSNIENLKKIFDNTKKYFN